MDKKLFVEPPVISSTLRWEDVFLPASISEADLDQIIFSVMTSRLQKTAMIIVKALERCKELDLQVNAEVIGARLKARAISANGAIAKCG
jgi:hypothetical protein